MPAYTSVSTKPDTASSATISDNSGIALRFGPDNTGTIADAVSWGKTENGFKNISAANPGANQSLARKDLYQPFSDYAVIASAPHNSAMTDLAAAFSQSGNLAAPPVISSPIAKNNRLLSKSSRRRPLLGQKLVLPRFRTPKPLLKSSPYRLRWFLLSRRRAKPNIYSWRPGLCWL